MHIVMICCRSLDACGPSPLTPDEIRDWWSRPHGGMMSTSDLAVAVASAESDFDRNRNSPKGARGPMQLMPGHGRPLRRQRPSASQTGNIDARRPLSRPASRRVQNPMLALAAYNAGEDRIYEYGGIPPFPETVSYVAKVVNHQLGLPMPRREEREVRTARRRMTPGRSRRRHVRQAPAVGRRRHAVLSADSQESTAMRADHLNQHRRSREGSC